MSAETVEIRRSKPVSAKIDVWPGAAQTAPAVGHTYMGGATVADSTCIIDGCDRTDLQGHGWCVKHYSRWRRGSDDPSKLRRSMTKGVCSLDDCDGEHYAKTYCCKHYNRWLIHGSTDDPRPSFEERLWGRIERGDQDECWLWTGGTTDQGYGHISRDGEVEYVHRAVYELEVGPIEDGLQIDHLCHNEDPDCGGGRCDHRRCVNPAHLDQATNRQNFLRGHHPQAEAWREDRCLAGHPFDEANTYIRPDTGARQCRACARERESS